MAKIPFPKKDKAKAEKPPKKGKKEKGKKEKVKKEKGKKKKKKKVKKKKTKVQILISILLLLFLAGLFFLMFGGDHVPKQIQNMKGYSYIADISDAAKDKLPDKLKLPVELPFDVPKLHFDIPNPFANFFGDKKSPDQEKIKADLAEFLKGKESEPKIEALEIEKRKASDQTEIIYVAAEMIEGKAKAEEESGDKAETKSTDNEDGEETTVTNYYKLQYKLAFIGGWKLKEAQQYNVEGENSPAIGVKNKVVVKDDDLTVDLPADWKVGNVKVLEHFLDAEKGTDTVTVYIEMKNDFVKMAGTKEVVYVYNTQSQKWEISGEPSKLSCTYMEPLKTQ